MPQRSVADQLIVVRPPESQIKETARRHSIWSVESAHVRAAQRSVLGDHRLHLVAVQHEVTPDAVHLLATGQFGFAAQGRFKDFRRLRSGSGKHESEDQFHARANQTHAT